MAKLRSSLSMVCAILTAFSVSGCAVRSDPVLTTSSPPVGQMQEIALLASEAAPDMRNQFRDALASELSAQGIVLREGAAFVGDFSISATNAEVPLYTSEAGPTVDEPVAVVIGRERAWTDSCVAVRTRASLAIYRLVDGALVHRSVAEALVCDGDSLPLGALAKVLVGGVAGS